MKSKKVSCYSELFNKYLPLSFQSRTHNIFRKLYPMVHLSNSFYLYVLINFKLHWALRLRFAWKLIVRKKEKEAPNKILTKISMKNLFLNLNNKYRWKAPTWQHWNVVYSGNNSFFKSQNLAPRKLKTFIAKNVISDHRLCCVIYLSFNWLFQLGFKFNI